MCEVGGPRTGSRNAESGLRFMDSGSGIGGARRGGRQDSREWVQDRVLWSGLYWIGSGFVRSVDRERAQGTQSLGSGSWTQGLGLEAPEEGVDKTPETGFKTGFFVGW